MKILIVALILGVSHFSSPYKMKTIAFIKNDTPCCTTIAQAAAATRKINVWMKTAMTKSDNARWIASGKKLVVLPHQGAVRVIHDTAWKDQ
jgi:hypothetical protein